MQLLAAYYRKRYVPGSFGDAKVNSQRLFFLTLAFVGTCVIAGVVVILLVDYRSRSTKSGKRIEAFDELSIERTPCYGLCPTYRITISRTGEVQYEGIAHVAVKGAASAQLGDAELQQLISAVNDADFFALRDSYVDELDGCPTVWTDNASVIITVKAVGQRKTIRSRSDRSPKPRPRDLCH